jgi:hypothetical protein
LLTMYSQNAILQIKSAKIMCHFIFSIAIIRYFQFEKTHQISKRASSSSQKYRSIF